MSDFSVTARCHIHGITFAPDDGGCPKCEEEQECPVCSSVGYLVECVECGAEGCEDCMGLNEKKEWVCPDGCEAFAEENGFGEK